MARKSPKDRLRARTRVRQKSTKSAQEFSNLDADLVQRIHELLLDWRGAVEARNPKSIFVTEGRRSDWQRAVHPDPANKSRTWWKHVDRVVGFFQEEWNSIGQEDEEPLKLTRAAFLRGPPGRAMRPIASADLQELPSLGSAGIIHLHGYLDDLRVRVEKSQALQNIVAERALRDSIVSALENLGHWSFCADEMEHLVQINEQLQDFTEVGRCLLRQGIALYRAEQFTGAKAAFEKALNMSNRKLPVRADLKTQLRIRDYLGLCHLRLKKTKIALKTLQESKAIAAKNRMAIPLTDASRLMRLGIAHFENGEYLVAKNHFIKALEIRVEYRAMAEAARAVRYLGSFYFASDKITQALCLWGLCLKRQQALGDRAEQAKTHFFRGRALVILSEKSADAGVEEDFVECDITPELFPDGGERELLKRFASGFRDSRRKFYRAQYISLARFSFNRAREIAKSHGLKSWALEATLALAELSKTVGSGNQRRRNSMATAGAAFSRKRVQRDSKKR